MPVSISGDGSITGLELNDFEDVAGVPDDGDALVWDAATSSWVPEVVAPTSLDAAVITSGTFDAARIPNLDAEKIATGTFNEARIPGRKIRSIRTVQKGDVFSYLGPGVVDVPGLSVTFAPQATDSLMLVMLNINVGRERFSSDNHAWVTNASNTILNPPTAYGGVVTAHAWAPRGGPFQWSVQFVHSPNTTANYTYKVRIQNTSTAVEPNRAVVVNRGEGHPVTGISTIQVIEFSP